MTKTTQVQRTYELTYLIPATLSDADVSKVKEAVTGLVSKHNGTIITTEEWGKKHMAYSLKHGGSSHSEAHYVHLVLSMTPEAVLTFEKDVYLQNNVMRHLLVVADEKKAEKSSTTSAA